MNSTIGTRYPSDTERARRLTCRLDESEKLLQVANECSVLRPLFHTESANFWAACGNKPPRENVQEEPRTPQKTSCAIRPLDPIACQHDQNADDQCCVQRTPIDPIRSPLRLLVHISMSYPGNSTRSNCDRKCQCEVHGSPPVRQACWIPHQPCHNRKGPRKDEQDRGY